MTLTSRLDLKSDPLRIFLHERFPNTKILINEIRTVASSRETIRPQIVVPWSLLGWAIDFRICGYYRPVAFHGFPGLGHLWGEEEFDMFCMDLSEQLEERSIEISSVGRRLERSDEEWLCRFCVVLAMFEVIERSGKEPTELMLLDPNATTTEAFLAGIPQEWVDDMCQMSWAFYDASAKLLKHPTILSPSFVGSEDVGGADADFIVDNCLLEIKSTVDLKRSRPEWIYQILGYSLLDYSNEYEITSVGFYLVRQGTYIRWSLHEFMTILSGKESILVAELRGEVKALLAHPATGDDTFLSKLRQLRHLDK